MNSSRYEFYRDGRGEWRWRLKAANGEIVSSGEGYKTRGGVLRGVSAHRRAAATLRVIERTA